MGAMLGKSNREGADSNERQYAALSCSTEDLTERYLALITMLELAESCLGSEAVRQHVDESLNMLLKRCMNHEVIVKLVDNRVFVGRFRALSSDRLKIGLEDAYNRDMPLTDGAPDSKKLAFQVKEVADIRSVDEGRKWAPPFLHVLENSVKASERLTRPDSTVNLSVEEEDSSEPVYDILQDRFVVGRAFTDGTHGTLRFGFDRMNGRRVAVKISNARSSNRIKNECAVYESLKHRELAQWNAFPHLLWHGKRENQHLIVMQLLGPSLKSFFAHCDYYLPLKHVFLLGEQMVRLLETFHAFGWLHRDLKPDNFVMGKY
ncbi:casein kinase family protein [Aphelenchoides avenae]|nr:casein kinase family protein [Aphelenchus avenae]